MLNFAPPCLHHSHTLFRLPSDPTKPIRIDLPISHAGAFVYWIEYEAESGRVKGREGYFNIDPILRTKSRKPILTSQPSGGELTDENNPVSLDGLAVLTVVSKWMGPVDNWRPYFEEAQRRGYNMLHYTPLQQRGESQSPYSIADQTAYDSELFPREWKGSREEGIRIVQAGLQAAREEYGLMSLTDIVLNHTANNSDWLLDHPEAGFSPHNAPHLTPALEIDNAMVSFSSNLGSQGLPTKLISDSDFNKVMGAFKAVMEGLSLWQYYVIDVSKQKADVRAALDFDDFEVWSGKPVKHSDVVSLAKLVKQEGLIENLGAFSKRFCATINPRTAASLATAAFVDVQDKDALTEAWIRVVDVINVELYEEANHDLKAALEGIENRVRYTRLDSNGPKLGEISERLALLLSVTAMTFSKLAQSTSRGDILHATSKKRKNLSA